jgi:hypothetical protein
VVALPSFCSLLLPSPDLSDSSASEVTLSSVSASMPVLLSEVEVSVSEASLEEAASLDEGVASASVIAVDVVVSVLTSVVLLDSTRAGFFALARASLRSSFSLASFSSFYEYRVSLSCQSRIFERAAYLLRCLFLLLYDGLTREI